MPPPGGIPTKRKVKRKPVYGPPAPKPKVKVVPSGDQVDRNREARKQQLKKSVRLAGDAPQDREADTKRADAYKQTDAYVKTVRDARSPKIKKQDEKAAHTVVKRAGGVHSEAQLKAFLRTGRRTADVPMAQERMQAVTAAPALKVLEQTTRPIHAIAGAADAAVQHRNVPKAALRGLQNKDKTTFSTVLKHAGVKNKYVRGGVGFALDVGLDPTTYLTAGTGKVVLKSAAKKAAADATGATLKVAGKEIPGVRKATAKAGQGGGKVLRKVVPERARNAVRDAVSEVNPNVAPAGVDKATHDAARTVARKARARTNQGQREAINLAHGIKHKIGPANYAKVVDAIEAEGVPRESAAVLRKKAADHRQIAAAARANAAKQAASGKYALGKGNAVHLSKLATEAEKQAKAFEAHATHIDAHGHPATVADLPEHLRGHAQTLRAHLATIRKVQRDAGVKVPERKGYIPRNLTPETIKAENKKAAQVGGHGKTEPGSSKARKEQRTMAEVRTAEPGRYRQDLHALVAERMAEGTASAARANLAQDLAKLGHPVARGTNPHLSEREAIYRVKKGEDLKEIRPSDKKFAKPAKGKGGPTYVVLNRSLVDRTMGTVQAPRGGTIAHGYDKTQAGFKRLALATPGFHIRNVIGDTSQAYVHQPGQKLPGNMVRAGRVLKAAGRIEKAQRELGTVKAGKGKLKTKHYGHVTYEEAAQKLIDAGAARSGYTSRELRELASSGSKKIRQPKSPAGVRRAFLNREDLPRLATAIHALRQGATYEEAAAKVASAHFDYADLTPFERDVARRIMPFYTWTARNVPLQSKRLVTNPGKYAAYEKAREEAKAVVHPEAQDPQTRDLYKRLEVAGVKLHGGWEKYLSTFEQRNAGVPVSWKGHKFTLSAGLPLQDLNELPGISGPGEYLNKAASLVTPLVKDPVEFGFNYNFFFRDQVQRDNSPLVAAPGPVGKWPAWAKKKFGVVRAIDKRSGKMIWQWPGKADYVAHAVPGLPSAAVKMMTPGHDRQGKGAAGKALSIAGVKATPLDATTNAINLAYARLQEIGKLKGLLNQQGVGVRQGNVTPEYRKLLDQEKALKQIAYQGKAKRGDKILPTQGGPPKVRRPKAAFDFGGGGQQFDFSSGSQDFDFG